MSEKVIDILKSAEKSLFTFELLPPLKGHTIEEIYAAIDPLVKYAPAYINVTYHQQETEYFERPDGLLEKRIVRKRPGTVAIAAAIKYRYNLPVVPHLICGGFTREETEDALIDLHFLGIRNVLVLRGDAHKGQRRFKAEPGGHAHASDLVSQVQDMNRGVYLHDLHNASPTDFCIGVAGYPEKHIEAANSEQDLFYLKQKVDKGADYIVTQMFFDNARFFSFVEACRKIGIKVPILPGIKPISALSDLRLLPQTFAVDLPEALVKEIKKCKTTQAVRQVGVEWSIMQSKELVGNGVPGVHYYTLGQSDNIQQIAKAVF